MRRAVAFCVLLACLVVPGAIAGAEGEAARTLDQIGVTTVFPQGWTVVTPDTVERHFTYFTEETPADAEDNLIAEGVYAIAFSPEGDAELRVMASKGDNDAALYFDIERYEPKMRTAIKDRFLDKSVWAYKGWRYTEASWTNKEGQGRLLHLTYTVRDGETVTERGKQVYTVRNGLAITLDLRVKGRRIETADERIFNAFVTNTTFPVSEDMPLLPVGLLFTGVVPEETYEAAVTVRGESMKGAKISAMIIHDDGTATTIGETTGGSGGTFKLEMSLPGAGEYRLYFRAELDGYAACEDTRWITYVPRQIPVTFTSYPEGVYTESQVIISGKTLAGVAIQCMEGEVNKKTTTGSDGGFSIKMDRGIVGERTIVLSLNKNGFDNRRFEIVFDRQWAREDYAKYLADKVQSLSFKNLTENPQKYVGRLVKYTGEVLDISYAENLTYVQLGMKKDKEGAWTERIVAVAQGLEVTLREGDRASLYIEVTGEVYGFGELNDEGDTIDIDLPSVKLLTYE